MLLLFVIHNLMNTKWYGSLFKGKYGLLRTMQTMVNFSLLISMLCLGFSGIVMSRHVFAVFSVKGPMATARSMHMAASYWGFVLMGIHLGMHWGMVIGMFRRMFAGKEMTGVSEWALRLTAMLVAGYGLFCFLQKDIFSYMFLWNQFVFFDFEQGAASVAAEYLAMMGFWVFAGYYAAKGCRKI